MNRISQALALTDPTLVVFNPIRAADADLVRSLMATPAKTPGPVPGD